MINKNNYYIEYKKFLEETELYLTNISMWEIIYFYYFDKYFSYIFEKLNETKKKIIYILNEQKDNENEILINIMKKYVKNSKVIDFTKDSDIYVFYEIKLDNINDENNNHTDTDIDIKNYANNNYDIVYIKRFVDIYNVDVIIKNYNNLKKNKNVEIIEVNYKNYKSINYNLVNCINFEDIYENIILDIKEGNDKKFVKKIISLTKNNPSFEYEFIDNLYYVKENNFSYIFDLAKLININQNYFIKLHKERKDYLDKYFEEFKINVNWDEFKKINLYARDYYRYLTTEQIEYFIFNVKRCIKKLNNLSINNKKYVLAPGDSCSKIVLYIEKLNLCPNCKFMLFPLSNIKIKNKNTIKYIESFIPNDFSNLIIMDYILTGSSLKVLIEALKSKLNKYPTEKNKLTFEKIEHDVKIILSHDKNDETEKNNELNNYDNYMNLYDDDEEKKFIDNIKNIKKYTSNYIIDPIVKYDWMDGYNPLSIDSFSRCVPSNPKHIKVKKEEYDKIKYECDMIQYILILNGENEKYFETFSRLYYYLYV